MVFAIINNISGNVVAKFRASDLVDATRQFAEIRGWDTTTEFLQNEPLVAQMHIAVPLN